VKSSRKLILFTVSVIKTFVTGGDHNMYFLCVLMMHVFGTVTQDGSTMLMEAAKGGHFETMSLLLDWPATSGVTHSAALTDAASHTNKVFAATLLLLHYTELAGSVVFILSQATLMC